MRPPVLHGEMVRLRTVEPRDADRLWESLHDPEGKRLTGTTRTFTRAEIDDWVATIPGRAGRYDWTITAGAVRDGELVSDEYIGEIVLNDIDPVARSANLRLAMMPDYRGRGYGREAICEVLRFAFDGEPHLHRVGLDVLSINPRAKALYESLGFVEEGRLRDAYRDGSSWADAIVMSILEDEFRDLHGRQGI